MSPLLLLLFGLLGHLGLSFGDCISSGLVGSGNCDIRLTGRGASCTRGASMRNRGLTGSWFILCLG